MLQSRRRSLLSLVAARLLAGCGDGPAGTGGTPPLSATVNVGNIFFQSVHNASMDPAIDTVATGGTITWTWTETGTHTVRFDDGGFAESPTSCFSARQPVDPVIWDPTLPTSGSMASGCPRSAPA